MNCVFENISVQKLENLQEMYKRTLRAGFLVYGILVVILFASFLATSLITGASSPVYIVFFVIVILLSGNWMIQMPKKNALTTYEGNQEQYQCEPQNHIFFYGNKMKGRNLQSGVEIQVPYDKVVQVMETKHLFLIRIPEKRILLVDKSGFQRGNADDFRSFLKEKCTTAKFR